MHSKTSLIPNLFIDFGSGYNPKEGYKTCDFINMPFLDYVAIDNRIYDGIKEIEDKSVDIIYCRNVLHHIKDLNSLFQNFYRYLKDDGKLEIIECSKQAYYANWFLDTLWYRYVIPRKEVWFSDKYRNYVEIAKMNNFKILTNDIENEKEHFIFYK